MKRNLSYHIPMVFLVLIFGTFSLLRVQANTKKFDSSFYLELSQKQAASVHTPSGNFNSSAEDLFEKETEDESEDEFNVALPFLNLIQNFTALLFSETLFSVLPSNEGSEKNQDPLYLAIRNIRI